MDILYIIGLGLHDENSMTLEALETCRKADIIFMERYTSILSEGSVEIISKRLDKNIVLLDREQIENGSFLKEAIVKSVALLVPGDPMTATTHVDLRIRAYDLGIKTIVVHGTSALVAVPGILGLQHYKFGRTITIPYPKKGFNPTSPFEQLIENHTRGLHTLALLDIQSVESRYMTANEGLKWIVDTARGKEGNDIDENTLACVVARAGSPSCIVRADFIKNLLSIDFGPPLHSIVIPGRLHFEEVEALKRFAGAPVSLSSDR